MKVWIGAGSNQEAVENLRRGVDLLRDVINVTGISQVYQSDAVAGDSAAYLNAVVSAETELTLPELKAALVAIEDRCGRVRWQADGTKSKVVTLDFDILLADDVREYQYGEKVYALPHPDIRRHAHTAIPLSDLFPGWIDPESGMSLRAIIKRMDVSGLALWSN
jgi:2-amino-4-hydroxy-6-hydroxymethyldihydropteridine diphosphokinase